MVFGTEWVHELDTKFVDFKHFDTSAYFKINQPNLKSKANRRSAPIPFPSVAYEHLHVSCFYCKHPISQADVRFMWRVGKDAITRYYDATGSSSIVFKFIAERNDVLEISEDCSGFKLCQAVMKANLDAHRSRDVLGSIMVPHPHMSWH